MKMKGAPILGLSLAMATALCSGAHAKDDGYQLPPEVTPAIQAACETDVRRLCVDDSPSMEKVKICVLAKFFKLNKQCQLKLINAGFSPG